MKFDILAMLTELRPEFDFTDSDDFIVDGLLDSFDVISLTSMIEEKFDIKIDGLDIVPENFSSVDSIKSLIKRTRENENDSRI